jgi:hypothetical protein
VSGHVITKAIVRGAGGASVLRATCSCGGVTIDAARLSTAARRRQDRLIGEHMASVQGAVAAAALIASAAIEAPL